MKNIKSSILVVLFLFSTNLIAFSAYVNVGDVRTKNELSYPYKKLKSMGYKMLYSKKSSGYLVYVGPFRSEETLRYSYHRIKREFPTAKVVTQDSQTTQTTESEKSGVSPSSKSGFLLGLGLGYGSAPLTSDANSSLAINEPKNSGINYLLYCGYDFENGLSLLLNYMQLNTGDLAFTNIYTSLNYNIPLSDTFIPYVGLSLGYSALYWSVNPIETDESPSSNDSGDMMYGLQVGSNYLLTKHLSLKLDYSYMFLKQVTYITQTTGEVFTLEYKAQHSLLAILQYKF